MSRDLCPLDYTVYGHEDVVMDLRVTRKLRIQTNAWSLRYEAIIT